MRHHRHQKERQTTPREQKPPKGFRKLHIVGEVWHYRITKAGISIIGPQRERAFVDMSVFTGWDNDTLERASWKGYWPKIGPSHVKAYILKYDMSGPGQTVPAPGRDSLAHRAGSEWYALPPFPEGTTEMPTLRDGSHPVIWRYPAHKKERHLAQAS